MKHAVALLALCNARLPDGMATCAVELAPGDAPPEWLQLMPMGAVKPNDGREPWTLTDAGAVIAASRLPALIDFDHGTQTRNDSRAAAWIEQLAAQGPAGEPGLWAKIDWVKDGVTALASKSYRFFSPTFLYDASRKITKIVGGSLVNNPALDELPALASTQEKTLNRTAIITALGLSAEATDEQIMAAISACATAQTAMASSMVAICAAAGMTLAADKIGENEITAVCAKLKAPAVAGDVTTLVAQVDDLQKQLATLSATQAGATASQKVDQAIVAGKITPAQKDWALGYCARDAKGFDDFIAKAPTILSNGTVQQEQPADGALTPDQLAICRQTGVKPDDFKKTLAAQKKDAA